MAETEYVKICYNQLLRNSRIYKDEEKYNWCLKVKKIFCMCGFGRVWDEQDISELLIGRELLLSRWAEVLAEEDRNCVANSKSCTLYYKILSEEQSKDLYYIHYGTRNMIRCISQCRLGKGYLCFKKLTMQLEMNTICSYCGRGNEDIIHMFLKCTLHERDRKKYISEYSVKGVDDYVNMINILANIDDDKMRCILLFVLGTIRTRNFMKLIEEM